MARVSTNVARLKRKNKILKHAKGYFGRRKNLYKTAKEAVELGWAYSYSDLKSRKRDFRRLGIIRSNASARQHELTYSRFMNGLKLAGIELNRMTLAELAVRDPNASAQLAEQARAKP